MAKTFSTIASPTHVRLKEEVKRLEGSWKFKTKNFTKIDVLLHPSNRAL